MGVRRSDGIGEASAATGTETRRGPICRWGLARSERRGFFEAQAIGIRFAPRLPPSPHWGMTSTRLLNPLDELIGSKSRSLRPVFVLSCPECTGRTLTGQFVHGSGHHRRSRHARRMGLRDIHYRGFGLGARAPDRRRLPSHMAHRRSQHAGCARRRLAIEEEVATPDCRMDGRCYVA